MTPTPHEPMTPLPLFPDDEHESAATDRATLAAMERASLAARSGHPPAIVVVREITPRGPRHGAELDVVTASGFRRLPVAEVHDRIVRSFAEFDAAAATLTPHDLTPPSTSVLGELRADLGRLGALHVVTYLVGQTRHGRDWVPLPRLQRTGPAAVEPSALVGTSTLGRLMHTSERDVAASVASGRLSVVESSGPTGGPRCLYVVADELLAAWCSARTAWRRLTSECTYNATPDVAYAAGADGAFPVRERLPIGGAKVVREYLAGFDYVAWTAARRPIRQGRRIAQEARA